MAMHHRGAGCMKTTADEFGDTPALASILSQRLQDGMGEER